MNPMPGDQGVRIAGVETTEAPYCGRRSAFKYLQCCVTPHVAGTFLISLLHLSALSQ